MALKAKAVIQRSSLDTDREHRDSNPPVTDSNDVEDVIPNHISFLEELRLQGLGKWLQRCRVMLHHVAGTPERAWLHFSLIFILETVVVAIFRPKTIKHLNATHQHAENLSLTSKPRKVHDDQTNRCVSGLHGSKCSSRSGTSSGRDKLGIKARFIVPGVSSYPTCKSSISLPQMHYHVKTKVGAQAKCSWALPLGRDTMLRDLVSLSLTYTLISAATEMLSVSTINFWVKVSTLLQYGFIAWMLSTFVGLLLSFLRPSTAGARATSATENTVRCSRAEVYNRWSTNERLNVDDSPQVSEATVHPSVELSDSSVPSSSPTSKTSKQTQSNRTVAPKIAQEKRLVANSPRPRTSDCIKRNKDFKAEDKTKVVARRTGNNEMRKDVRSVDLSHITRVGRLAVGVAC
ncbi:hypothetical protein CQW23_34817 [Capsicum baccatum]|uniref:Uncharacterized protein n=1 Tax=Capsicum baccatum TaxID=33114 RepID=A0A2G2UY49_CAPBA|nr:hypothetical protein CQW23_34817 [Capsicum baccatum]